MREQLVGPLEGIQTPLGFVKNEKLILLREDEDQTIALYNIGSQEIKNFQHSGLPNSFRSRHARLYVESLVSLNALKIFGDKGDKEELVEGENWARNQLMAAGSDLLGKFSNLQALLLLILICFTTST
nr:hypothetical protein CFP56_41618 [Quercus suber]POE90527.1 hypothetical protein CFP56_41619 [Quercus suber]